MDQVDSKNSRRGPWAALMIATVAAASAVAIAFPATSSADPPPAPPAPPNSTVAPAPGQAAPPADPNAPAADSIAPLPADTSRLSNPAGGFSFVLPAGWVESDASHLDYGSELLSKTTGQSSVPGQAPAVANDTRIVMGRLDQKLYANAEPNNAKAALRLGSDMGEFFLPYPGTRINQESVPLTGANGITGSGSFYEVKFSDASKPNGQIWTGVVGLPAATTANSGPPQRWFVVWLGTANNPVDQGAAKALAESIEPWSSPAAPPGAAPEQATPVAPASPAPLGVAPTQPPAGDVPNPAPNPSPNPALVPQRTLPPS
jgi:hypothetical protein